MRVYFGPHAVISCANGKAEIKTSFGIGFASVWVPGAGGMNGRTLTPKEGKRLVFGRKREGNIHLPELVFHGVWGQDATARIVTKLHRNKRRFH